METMGEQSGSLLFKICYGEEIWETEQKAINEEKAGSALTEAIGNIDMKYKRRPGYSGAVICFGDCLGFLCLFVCLFTF